MCTGHLRGDEKQSDMKKTRRLVSSSSITIVTTRDAKRLQLKSCFLKDKSCDVSYSGPEAPASSYCTPSTCNKVLASLSQEVAPLACGLSRASTSPVPV